MRIIKQWLIPIGKDYRHLMLTSDKGYYINNFESIGFSSITNKEAKQLLKFKNEE